MKKLVVIMSIFMFFICLAVLEVVYSNNFYNRVLDKIQFVEQSFLANEDNLNNLDTITKISAANSEWEKGKRIILLMNHHATVKYIDEKMVSMIKLVEMNQYYDAFVALKTSQNYIKDLLDDSGVRFYNIF